MAAEQPAACPWCGGFARTDCNPDWFVECAEAGCHARGPQSYDEEHAVADWNRVAAKEPSHDR